MIRILDVALLSTFVLLYFVIATLLNERFEEFVELLMRYGMVYVSDNNKSQSQDNDRHIHFLMHYVKFNKVQLKLGGFVVTKQNAMISIIGFILGRIVTYLASVVIVHKFK